MNENKHDKIFGYSWEDIRAMQHGTYRPRIISSADSGQERIQRDILVFHIDVALEVVEKYRLYLPDGYVLKDGIYTYTHK